MTKKKRVPYLLNIYNSLTEYAKQYWRFLHTFLKISVPISIIASIYFLFLYNRNENISTLFSFLFLCLSFIIFIILHFILSFIVTFIITTITNNFKKNNDENLKSVAYWIRNSKRDPRTITSQILNYYELSNKKKFKPENQNYIDKEKEIIETIYQKVGNDTFEKENLKHWIEILETSNSRGPFLDSILKKESVSKIIMIAIFSFVYWLISSNNSPFFKEGKGNIIMVAIKTYIAKINPAYYTIFLCFTISAIIFTLLFSWTSNLDNYNKNTLLYLLKKVDKKYE